jgi:dipeptidyl aminopeptidase/acylaminoacyl peptidase
MECNMNKRMKLIALSISMSLLSSASTAMVGELTPRQPQHVKSVEQTSLLSLEKIMSNPDWMGIAPERSYFSSDGKSVYFVRKAEGSELRDLYKVSKEGGKAQKLNAAQTVIAESEQRVWSRDLKQTAWIKNGNLFLSSDGKQRQLSRTGDWSGLLGFIGQDKLALRAGGRINLLDLQSGVLSTLIHVRTEDDPLIKVESPDYLTAQQSRLFDIIKKREKNKADFETRNLELSTQPENAPTPIYLGKGREIRTMSVSPDGRFVVVGTVAPRVNAKGDKMPHYVSANGYVNIEDVRSKVGNDQALDERVFVIDVASSKVHKVVLDALPGIFEDPLWNLKLNTAKKAGKPEPKAAGLRAVYLGGGSRGVQWSDTKSPRLALSIFSYDNKDRWIIEVDLQNKAKEDASFKTIHRLTDQAWVNDGDFNEFAWSRDGDSLWYLSEESGYSQLYSWKDGKAKALTMGKFEVSRITPSLDGKWMYYRANKKHPGIFEIYRIATDESRDEVLTNLNGMTDYELSSTQDQLLLTHSTVYRQPDLFVLASNGKGNPLRLTNSTSDEFTKINWIQPEIVAIPSKHGAAPIYSRVYRDSTKQNGEKKPVVMFVHGAGYLQAAHHGWSTYFRETMFHTLLVQQGFVVIDMDYRASAGYGRDWRNAIYQRMGTPELEDYLDGIDWLVDNANADRNRIGIYGGSYGGFMTFMAMFKAPDAFAAGAALRPVTDWAHYNHGYTSNILNTPQVDPDAYLRSSPIEFAANLKGPLLICSGILDDNVFFQDSVRLVQRLIELKKPNFELAVYPIEPHGFREPESWLDEYRRIYKLMINEVKNKRVEN